MLLFCVFDSAFKEGAMITLRYISDGLGNNGNFDNVLVPKMAEDAVYANILYNLASSERGNIFCLRSSPS